MIRLVYNGLDCKKLSLLLKKYFLHINFSGKVMDHRCPCLLSKILIILILHLFWRKYLAGSRIYANSNQFDLNIVIISRCLGKVLLLGRSPGNFLKEKFLLHREDLWGLFRVVNSRREFFSLFRFSNYNCKVASPIWVSLLKYVINRIKGYILCFPSFKSVRKK